MYQSTRVWRIVLKITEISEWLGVGRGRSGGEGGVGHHVLSVTVQDARDVWRLEIRWSWHAHSVLGYSFENALIYHRITIFKCYIMLLLLSRVHYSKELRELSKLLGYSREMGVSVVSKLHIWINKFPALHSLNVDGGHRVLFLLPVGVMLSQMSNVEGRESKLALYSLLSLKCLTFSL